MTNNLFHSWFQLNSNDKTEKLEKQINDLEKKLQEIEETKDNYHRFATIIRDSNDAIMVQDLDGNISAWNCGAEKIYGYSEAEALKMNVKDLTPVDKIPELIGFMDKLKNGQLMESFETKRLSSNGKVLDIWLTVTALKDMTGQIRFIATTERDITKKKKREIELEQMVESLQCALAEIKTLQGILPICCYCKNIRTDEGYYEQIESYLHKNSGVDFSHTICPSCMEKHHPEGYTLIKKKKKERKGITS